jgi:hypothetical protein
MAHAAITITRKQARRVIELLPNDEPETGAFFEALMNQLDEEQGLDPDDREGIEINITGKEM